MASLGATIVDTDTGDVFAYSDDEFTALLFEFKTQIAQYLQTLSHTNLRTLADLIDFDNAHCVQELVYYGQEIFELAETEGDLSDPTYIVARNHATTTARAGIDGAMARDNLDAIVAPHLTNSTGPALAGYPNFSMPVGIRSSGRPGGHADVQHLPGRTAVVRDGVRSRASATRAATTAIPGLDHSNSERGVVHSAASAAGSGTPASRPHLLGSEPDWLGSSP
jgi:hypothetical protein